MTRTLVASHLAVERGGREVLRDLSFTVAAGNALIATGPNGIGKTTLIRTIAGYLPSRQGSVVLSGGDDDCDIREELHYVGDANAIKATLTVRENLEFWSVYLGGDNDIERALEQFQLTALANISVGYLSSGQRRRTALARLLAARRPLWLLDEPTVALDDVSRDALIAAGDSHLNEGGIIVAATHLPLPFERTQALRLGPAGETE